MHHGGNIWLSGLVNHNGTYEKFQWFWKDWDNAIGNISESKVSLKSCFQNVSYNYLRRKVFSDPLSLKSVYIY